MGNGFSKGSRDASHPAGFGFAARMRWSVRPFALLLLAIASILAVPAIAAPPANRLAMRTSDSAPLSAPEPQATLIFTATSLRKGYRGINVGIGSVYWYRSSERQLLAERGISNIQKVNADRPVVRFDVPAGEPLSVASSWSSGGSFCLVDDLIFIPEPGDVYMLTNVQDLRDGVCRLYLKLASAADTRAAAKASQPRRSILSRPRAAYTARSAQPAAGMMDE